MVERLKMQRPQPVEIKCIYLTDKALKQTKRERGGIHWNNIKTTSLGLQHQCDARLNKT